MAIRTLKVAKMTGLWRVRSGKLLLWPIRVMSPELTRLNARGKPGYVVDLDQPYEKVICWNMERFLEPVPESETEAARARLVDPSDFPRPIMLYLSKAGLVQATPLKRKTSRKSVMMDRASQQEKPKGDAPALDTAPKGRTTRRRRGGDKDGAQSTTSTAGD